MTRVFRPAAGVTLHASGRVHRIEKHYEYSYRVLAVVGTEWKLKWLAASIAQPCSVQFQAEGVFVERLAHEVVAGTPRTSVEFRVESFVISP